MIAQGGTVASVVVPVAEAGRRPIRARGQSSPGRSIGPDGRDESGDALAPHDDEGTRVLTDEEHIASVDRVAPALSAAQRARLGGVFARRNWKEA